MQEEYLDRRHTGMMLTVVLFATLMDGLDGSIVTVAAPDIGIAFGVDTATISWVAITYMMVLAGSLILFARIAANYGIRQILAVGLALFTVSSLLCAVSVNFPMLIVGRILQGIGAAMMGATGPMCCARFLPPRRLGFGLALLTVGASVGFAVGPGVGGLIVEYLSWHWIFLINLPLGLIAIPLALAALPKEQNRGRTSIDWIGAALLAGAVVLGILAVETVSYPSQRPLTIGTGLGCLMLLVLFVRQELRTARPLLNVRLFRNLSFAGLFLCLALINLVYMGIWYLFPFYGEIWLGYSSARIGLYLLLSALITAVFGIPVARLSDRHGRRWYCVAAAALAGGAFLLAGLTARPMDAVLLFVFVLLMGLGWAFTGGPMGSWLVEHAEDPDRDMASSLINEAYYTGGAVGTALFAAVFTLTSGSEGIDINLVSGEVFLSGYVPCCLLAAAVCAVIALICLAVKNKKPA